MGVFAAQLTPVGQGRTDVEAGIGWIADQWRGRVEGDRVVVGIVESVPRQTAANAKHSESILNLASFYYLYYAIFYSLFCILFSVLRYILLSILYSIFYSLNYAIFYSQFLILCTGTICFLLVYSMNIYISYP